MQKGAIEITGYISPTSEDDTYPTHLDKYGKGGYRAVVNLLSLNNIPMERRSEGMLVYVININKLYKLTGGLTDDHWEEFISLPPLGTFTIGGITYPKIYVGTDSGVPEASESFGYALVDILALNARFLTGNFIMADALFKPGYPGAQFLNDLTDGILAKTGKTLRTAESGIDYVNIVDRSLCIEGSISTWLHDNNKTLRNTRVKIIEGTAQDGDDLQGIRTLIANAVISRGAITSDDSVFGLNNIGARELKIYDRQNGVGRLTKSVNFIAAYDLSTNVNFYLPESSSSLGQVLADVGETIYDGRIFRKLDFVDIASNSAKYILQAPNQSLPNAQALDVLGLGVLKVTAGGVLALAISGTDYVSPIALEEETTARVEADAALETSIVAVQGELEAQIAAITGFGSFALLSEFLANLGWTTGYSEYLWHKYRPLRTYNTYGDTDNYSKDGGNIWYDASHVGAAGAFKPGLRITSWDSSTVFANDLFPVSIGLFGYRNGLGQVGAQEGFVWQSYIENSSSSPNYRWPKNFGLYHVGHDDGAIGWNRKENLLMNYDYNSSSFSFEKKVILNDALSISSLSSGILKVTNGLVGLAIPDTDYATSELLEQIKTETEGFRNEAETFSVNALNSQNSAELSASNANTSALNAYNSETNAQGSASSALNSAANSATSASASAASANSSAISASSALTSAASASLSASNAKTSEDNTYVTYQEVADIVNNILNYQMTTNYANITINSALDPNNPAPKLQIFEAYYPADTTNTNPKLGTKYAIVDSSTPYTQNFSRYWQAIASMGPEDSLESNYSIDFYHKILNQTITPFQISINAIRNLISFIGDVNINNHDLYGLKKVGFTTGVDLTKAISLESFADIDFGGILSGKYNNLKFNSLLNIAHQSMVWDWGAYEGTISLINKLSNGNVYLPTFEYLIGGQFDSGSMWGISSTVSNILPGDTNGKFAIKFKNSSLNLNDEIITLTKGATSYLCSLNAELSLNSKPILNVLDDTSDSSATTRKFVIDYVAGHTTPVDITLTGDVVGTLSGNQIPTTISQTAVYNVINAVVNGVSISDLKKPTVSLDLNTQKIINLTTDGADSQASTCKWVKDRIGEIALLGAITGTINSERKIYTQLSNQIQVNNFDLSLEYSASASRVYSLLNMIPIEDAYSSPEFHFKSQVGDATSLRYWDMKFGLGSYNAIDSEFSMSLYHIALSGTHTITPFKISTSPLTKITVDGVLDLATHKIINVVTDGGENEVATCGFVNTAISQAVLPVTLTGAVTGSGLGTVATSFNPTQTISDNSNTQTWNFNLQAVGGDTNFVQKNIIDSSTNPGRLTERISRSSSTGNTIQDYYYMDHSSVGNSMLWQKQFVTSTGATFSPLSILKGNNIDPYILIGSDINLANKKIINSGSPTNSTDLVNKNYVDTKTLNTFPISGDVDFGVNRLSSSATPTSGNHLINKTYADAVLAGSGGGTWTAYTPTVTCPVGYTNPTLPSASNVFSNCQYTVVGKTMFIRFHLGINATGAKGSGLYLFSIPSGYTIDAALYYGDQDIVTRNASSTGGLSTDGYWSNFWQSQVGVGVVSHGSDYTTDVKVSPVYAQGNNKLCLFSSFLATTGQGFLMRNCYVSSEYFAFTGAMPAIYKFNATIKIL